MSSAGPLARWPAGPPTALAPSRDQPAADRLRHWPYLLLSTYSNSRSTDIARPEIDTETVTRLRSRYRTFAIIASTPLGSTAIILSSVADPVSGRRRFCSQSRTVPTGKR